MFTIESRTHVVGLSAREITDFLLEPSDELYQQWWPGTHLQLHVVRPCPDHRGEQVHLDEYIGARRFRMRGVVIEAVPGHAITWQVRRLVRLPVRLRLLVGDDGRGGVDVRHTISVGWCGLGAALDPVWRLLWFGPSFADDMDTHVRAEFARLPTVVRD